MAPRRKRAKATPKPAGNTKAAPPTLALPAGLMAVGVVAVVFVMVGATGGDTGKNPAHGSQATASSPAPEDAPAGPGTPGTPYPAAAPSSGTEGAVSATGRQASGVAVRAQPATGAKVLARIPMSTAVRVRCYVEGPTVSGRGGASGLWDRVVLPDGTTGYAPDIWLLTSAEIDRLVPHC